MKAYTEGDRKEERKERGQRRREDKGRRRRRKGHAWVLGISITRLGQ